MKHLKLLAFLLIFFTLAKAQNSTSHKSKTSTQMQTTYRKTITDFVAHFTIIGSMVSNGVWQDIGKINNAESILEKGLAGYYWKKKDINILNAEDLNYILFDHNAKQYIGVYKNGSFRIYDAFYYKNYRHPELNKTFELNSFFGRKKEKEVILKNVASGDMPNNKIGAFLEINEAYTFTAYEKISDKGGCAETAKGHYVFFTEEKIEFYFDEFSFNNASCSSTQKRKPFKVGTFKFTKDPNGNIVLKKVAKN